MTYPDELTRLSFSYNGNFAALLPFGTVTLNSFRGLPGPSPIAPDGWNWAPPLPWISSHHKSFERELEFLSSHDFIRATYKMLEAGVARVRIYILPEDCTWYRIRVSRTENRGRALLEKLWSYVDASVSGWLGNENNMPIRMSLISDDDVSLNLSAIFNSLPTPVPDPNLTACAPLMTRCLLESALEDDGVPGLKSQLYRYQRQSLWKMMQRELIPQRLPDPRLRKWIGPTGRLSWVNMEDMTFFRNQPYVDDVKGGILCEEMGTGKTCICLALILLTIHQRAVPPSGVGPSQKRFSSLYEQCFNTVIHKGIPFKHLDPRPHFYSALENAMPFYSLKPSAPKRAQRNAVDPLPETIYLSTATLVVVPDTLIQQWSTEILKHVQDNVLNYLVISKPAESIPLPSELLKLDLLLLSHSRFAKEEEDGNFQYRLIFPCIHYETSCSCHQIRQTPLLQIQWKRLIVDEGHILGQNTTRIVSLAGKLRVERRWCVTGTISNRMMGMDLGMERTLSGNSTNDDTLTSRVERAARKPEQIDLKRLGAIVIDFLHSPPFYNAEMWNRYVVRPYGENLHGSMSSLRSIMSIMIRHPAKEVEKDVKLPPLHVKTVVLHPTRENRLSINVIIALIALNAVLSQRTDQDYIFHPFQVKYREEVVRNLMLAMFHFNGTGVKYILDAINWGNEGLEKAATRGYSDEDVELLKNAIKSLREAIEDETWRTMVVRDQYGKEDLYGQEMGFTLAGCPEEVSDAWRLIPFDYPFTASPKQSQSIFSGPALLAMQSERAALTVTPKEEHISHLSNAGRIQRLAAQKKIEKAIEEALRKTRNKDGTPKKSLHKDAPVRSDEEQKFRKVVQHELQHHDMSMPKLPQKRPRPTQLLTPPASPPNTSLKSILKVNHLPNDIDELSPLKRILILRTASAKLNYLLKRIQALHETEKIIVFSDYGPMMWYLGEALEILGIEHLIYIQRLMPARRAQYIVTFNSSPHFRVLIMETKVAAHGLNVTAASRVFFMNACWQRSVERQAIKRAHRIGQQREVFVETLVLKGTIEEELLVRREEMGREQLNRIKRFTDDGKLRGIISSARFVPEEDVDDESVSLGQLFRAQVNKDEDIEKELDVEDKIVKRRKVVGFE